MYGLLRYLRSQYCVTSITFSKEKINKQMAYKEVSQLKLFLSNYQVRTLWPSSSDRTLLSIYFRSSSEIQRLVPGVESPRSSHSTDHVMHMTPATQNTEGQPQELADSRPDVISSIMVPSWAPGDEYIFERWYDCMYDGNGGPQKVHSDVISC